VKYRAEIDGLRALAVLPVILFHAGFEWFAGGFVGVDVFFVISGYLITTIIIEDIENKRFSIIKFYERRARRILPGLFFVMFACIPFAWMWMIPSEMKDFSQSLVAVSLFVSNVLFWIESGYFDAASEEKPLLHTWSLAVEEQYYLLFPIFLILAWRFGKVRVFWMIVVMAIISLLLSEWAWRNQPIGNFYLAPTRVWELFSGSIAAFIVQKHGVQKNNFLATLGLTAVVFSIFAYDETTPFPSAYALVPILGVVMLILYADKTTFATKLLSTKTFVGIGLISYSAYLWHQPLFAFARIKSLSDPSQILMGLLCVCSLMLAFFSWRVIETPFRNREVISKNAIFVFSVAGLVIFSIFGLAGHKKMGFESRSAGAHLPSDFYQYSYIEKPIRINECIDAEGFFCILNESDSNEYTTLLVGDSHSVDFQSQFLKHAFAENFTAFQYSITGCGFIFDNEKDCSKQIDALLSLVKNNDFDEIVFVTSLYGYTAEGYRDLPISQQQWTSYEANLKYLAKNTKNLFIFSPRYYISSTTPIKNIINSEEHRNNIAIVGKQTFVRDFYTNLSEEDGIHLYEQADFIKTLSGGADFTAKSELGYPLYRDSNHLTKYSAEKTYQNFLRFRGEIFLKESR
jgi:peptidoglycan/LPS O-acetylase OafA/YrhL